MKRIMLYINFTGLTSSAIEKQWERRTTPSLALSRYLPFKDELLIRVLLVNEAIKILFEKTENFFEKRVKLISGSWGIIFLYIF